MSAKLKKSAAPKKKTNGYKMPPPIISGEVIYDACTKKKWKIGPSIGVGGFGEIYSACDVEGSPKKLNNYPYAMKIEPLENGPLFVEMHFYIRNANKDEIVKFSKSKKLSSIGMPVYFGSGSHVYNGEKYRFLVLEKYGKDIWSIFKENNRSFSSAVVFQIGLQMLEVLEYIHSRGYVHGDLKGANILMGLKKGSENQAFLVDFGLASRIVDKEYKPNPKCAHNGTIEYTSIDSHLGAPTMRGDLEILAYNMLQWLVGELPWEKNLKNPTAVQELKEKFMKNPREHITKQYSHLPDEIIQFFEYIRTIKPRETPDYSKCRQIFEKHLKSLNKTRNSKIDFTSNAKVAITNSQKQNKINNSEDTVKKKSTKTNSTGKETRITRNTKAKSENVKPNVDINDTTYSAKRKSLEPVNVVKMKRPRVANKNTPPVKKNHSNIATQTSLEKVKSITKQVSFDSPISEVIGSKYKDSSADSSGDIFEDSFTSEGKKLKTKKKLVKDKKVVVKRTVRKKVTTIKTKTVKSWKDMPTIVNGKMPPK